LTEWLNQNNGNTNSLESSSGTPCKAKVNLISRVQNIHNTKAIKARANIRIIVKVMMTSIIINLLTIILQWKHAMTYNMFYCTTVFWLPLASNTNKLNLPLDPSILTITITTTTVEK